MRSQERMWPHVAAWAVTLLSVPMIVWGLVAGHHPAQLPLGLAVGGVGVVAVFLIVRDRRQAQASEIEALRGELETLRGKAL